MDQSAVLVVEDECDLADDYLTKPISRADLHGTVERLLTRSTYDRQVREYFALVSKKAVLEAEKSPARLENSDDLDGADSQAILRDLTRNPSDRSTPTAPEDP